jgi:hypothetical protein
LIETRLGRQLERNVKIDGLNRSGYKGLTFEQDLLDGTIATLEKARKDSSPVFPALLKMFPDLENSTNSTKFYPTLPSSTYENTIIILFSRIVEKYGEKKSVEKEKEKGNEGFSGEKLLSKNSTYSTFLPNEAVDNENDGRVLVEQRSEVVEEFLRDGGQASLQRFQAEFPEAA